MRGRQDLNPGHIGGGASARLSPLRHPLLPKGTFMKGENQKLFHFVTAI